MRENGNIGKYNLQYNWQSTREYIKCKISNAKTYQMINYEYSNAQSVIYNIDTNVQTVDNFFYKMLPKLQCVQ